MVENTPVKRMEEILNRMLQATAQASNWNRHINALILFGDPDDPDVEATRAFVAAAPEDLAWCLGEINRLTQELDSLLEDEADELAPFAWLPFYVG